MDQQKLFPKYFMPDRTFPFLMEIPLTEDYDDAQSININHIKIAVV